jgi:D-threo-aldose 1-dehydrogenase
MDDALNDTPAFNRASTTRMTVPIDPFELVPLGSTGLTVTRLGFGAASIGGLFRPVSDADGISTIRHAWDLGIRLFDAAPLYGYGAAERRLGLAVADRPREAYVLSTKVGRLVRDRSAIEPGMEIDRQSDGTRDDAYYADIGDRRIVFDYTAEGVRRSIEESLERLRLERIDIVFIHDPDAHWRAAIDEAYPALHRLRENGVVGAIGVGMNQSAMLVEFARAGDFDVFLLAGRYTLLDQGALDELLPLCERRRIAVLVGGVMNSGVLADPRRGSRFNYDEAPSDVIDRVRRIAAVCERHGVPLRAAAMQYPLAHPAVAGLITGVRSAEHLDEYPRGLRLEIPSGLWDELRREGLLDPEAPVPS